MRRCGKKVALDELRSASLEVLKEKKFSMAH